MSAFCLFWFYCFAKVFLTYEIFLSHSLFELLFFVLWEFSLPICSINTLDWGDLRVDILKIMSPMADDIWKAMFNSEQYNIQFSELHRTQGTFNWITA